MPIADPASRLCFKHAAAQKKDRDAANLASQLIGDTQEFTSAVAINRSLGELYKLLARDEIAPRRAAVMAYTGSLLLRTLPAIEHEIESEPQQIIFDLPRPQRDWPGREDRDNRQNGPTVIWDVTDDTDNLPRPDRSEPHVGVVHPTPAEGAGSGHASPTSSNGAPK